MAEVFEDEEIEEGCAIHLDLRQRSLMLLLQHVLDRLLSLRPHSRLGLAAAQHLLTWRPSASSLTSFVSPTFTHVHHAQQAQLFCDARGGMSDSFSRSLFFCQPL